LLIFYQKILFEAVEEDGTTSDDEPKKRLGNKLEDHLFDISIEYEMLLKKRKGRLIEKHYK